MQVSFESPFKGSHIVQRTLAVMVFNCGNEGAEESRYFLGPMSDVTEQEKFLAVFEMTAYHGKDGMMDSVIAGKTTQERALPQLREWFLQMRKEVEEVLGGEFNVLYCLYDHLLPVSGRQEATI